MPNTKHDRRLTAKQIQRILGDSGDSKPTGVLAAPPSVPLPVTFVGDEGPCDTLNPEEQIRAFREFIANVIYRYEGNIRVQEEAERQEQDLKHAIELADHLTDSEKRFLFRNLRKALKTRRACKSENEILEPIYEYVSNKALYNALGNIQGVIKNKKCNYPKQYSSRTSVLDGFRSGDAADERAEKA